MPNGFVLVFALIISLVGFIEGTNFGHRIHEKQSIKLGVFVEGVKAVVGLVIQPGPLDYADDCYSNRSGGSGLIGRASSCSFGNGESTSMASSLYLSCGANLLKRDLRELRPRQATPAIQCDRRLEDSLAMEIVRLRSHLRKREIEREIPPA